mmetsp:Transcript_2777/g.8717  ORF Transcript_2777/g.8717 Transcript_2777/m.8717 type:complete len:646 (+) Transcript_2777:2541-4478(+)|eukprot:CAMPEP_0174230198 /NCGR_PEP_ID=MMETSP0417-20130205/968_1 /TAXON_ID=242541 /ORGANISM="Mayorella sp, Strain BSH-02190019" /LENGTH=645 /DNA_ID=CAMNT_0015307839 /DNA_START=54 /DNA_END=1991 /DNA_ORIENTATION=-
MAAVTPETTSSPAAPQQTDATAPAVDAAAAAAAPAEGKTSTEGTAAPAAGAAPSTSLYVGDLHPDVAEGHLFEVFNRAGAVTSIRVCRDAHTRRSLGYAYVNYLNAEDAERALDTLNNTPIKERPCRIMWSQRDPSIRKSGVGNIFIKNLDKSIDHTSLYDTFSEYGNILSCKVAMDENGNSKGYGFVHYETQEMAKKAIEEVNGMEIEGKEVFVGRFVPRQERQSATATNFTNVFMKNLPLTWSEERLREVCSEFGTVTSVAMVNNEEATSRGYAYGFVNFETADAAREAVNQLNGKTVDGATLFAGRAQKKHERESELRSRWENIKAERAAKYKGVNLYVKNLDDDFTEEKMEHEFGRFGQITSCVVMRDNKGNSKGFGFVCFNNPEEAQKAINEMNARVVGTKPLYVALAQRKEDRRQHLEAQYRTKASRYPAVPGAHPMYVAAAAAAAAGAPPAVFYPPGVAPGQPGMPVPQQLMYQQQLVRNRMVGGPQQPYPVYQGGNYMMPVQRQQVRPGAVRAQVPGRRSTPYPAGARPGEAPLQQAQPLPEKLTVEVLQAFDPERQFLVVSQRMYPLIQKAQPKLAPKITGMIRSWYLENKHSPDELINLLENPEALNAKINEALAIWQKHVGETEGAAPAEKTEA